MSFHRLTLNSYFSMHRILMPLIVFTIVAFLVSFMLAIIYVPSTIMTALKLRSGVIPTFRNPNFRDYRVSTDTVTLLSGSLFWGCILASIIIGAISAIAVFFLVWQTSRPLVVYVLAALLGKIFKFMVTTNAHFCHKPYHSNFFIQVFWSL